MLETPELLSCVLENFDDLGLYVNRAALFNCLTVNRLWFNESSRLLWRKRSVTSLRQAQSLERQQYYANLIVHLQVGSFRQRAPRGLKYPSVEKLTVENPSEREMDSEGDGFHPNWVSQFLMKDLKELELCGGNFQGLLNILRVKCPNLEVLRLAQMDEWEPQLAQVFLANTTISELEAIGHLCTLEDDKTVGLIAQTETIKRLTVDRFSEDCFKALTDSGHRFEYLTHFTGTSDQGLCQKALQMMPNLTHFTYGRRGDNYRRSDLTIPDLIRHPTSFIVVSVAISKGDLKGEELVEFAKKNPNLQELELRSAPIEERHPVTIRGIVYDGGKDNIPLAAFTNYLPQLETLDLQLEAVPDFDCKQMFTIGKNCRKLTHLKFQHSKRDNIKPSEEYWQRYCNLIAAENTVLFPRLQNLDPPTYFSNLPSNDLHRRHFPRLQLSRHQTRLLY